MGFYMTSDNALVYRQVLQACGKSVLFAAGCFAFYGILVSGVSGAMGVFAFALVIGVFPMCIVVLLLMPLVFCSRRVPHPAVFSLLGMLAYILMATLAIYAIGPSPGSDEDESWVAGRIVLFSMLYGAPIGVFLRRERAKGRIAAHA